MTVLYCASEAILPQSTRVEPFNGQTNIVLVFQLYDRAYEHKSTLHRAHLLQVAKASDLRGHGQTF